MDSEQDIFSQGWSDESVVPDEREREALPAGEDPPAEDPAAAPPEGEGPPEELHRQIMEFVRAFPEVKSRDIPAEVWARVRAGQGLTEAFLMNERARLLEENERLRQAGDLRALNRSRAAGSQAGEGSGGERRDAFEEGWDMK